MFTSKSQQKSPPGGLVTPWFLSAQLQSLWFYMAASSLFTFSSVSCKETYYNYVIQAYPILRLQIVSAKTCKDDIHRVQEQRMGVSFFWGHCSTDQNMYWFFYFKDWLIWGAEYGDRKRWEEEREIKSDFLSAGLLMKWPQQPGQDQAKTRNQELSPSLLCGWQGLKHLSCHLPLLRHFSREQNGKQNLWLVLLPWYVMPASQAVHTLAASQRLPWFSIQELPGSWYE